MISDLLFIFFILKSNNNNFEIFKKSFPYDFIAEAIDQTRGWFYTLHVLGTLLFGTNAYKNVVCAGLLVDDKGEKMSKSKGNIINVASALGVNPENESPAYCSSKAAVIMLTKCMAQANASKNVRVNAILPGPIDTPLLRKSFKTQKELDEYAKTNPMKKIGSAEEVARVALFLASDDSSFITSSTYEVDGGETSSRISL